MDFSTKLAEMKTRRAELQSVLEKERANLAVIKSEHSRLLSEAKEKFGCSTVEELSTKRDKLSAEAEELAGLIDRAWALYQEGKYTEVTKLLGAKTTDHV